jgi:glutamate synthase (NADPH/NADH) small chain
MDCGIPFCNNGCPVNNIIPDFNDLVYRNDWKNAIEVLHSTNNFPEFTGRICPAPCEAACTLNINNDAVGIKSIEHAIIDRAWAEGWVVATTCRSENGQESRHRGSGPAGMAAAQQLARAGHAVTVFEKNDKVGGLLRFGIPDFKMDKSHIDRRVKQMEAEGVVFRTNTIVGETAQGQQGHQLGHGTCQPRATEERVRCRAADRWFRAVARPAGAGPRTERHPLRHGIPAQQNRINSGVQDGADPCRWQARDRDWWW